MLNVSLAKNLANIEIMTKNTVVDITFDTRLIVLSLTVLVISWYGFIIHIITNPVKHYLFSHFLSC